VRFPKQEETNDMSKNKQLTDLFIEDLGQVTGGKGPYATTLAVGEETATTLALGEEGSTWLGGEEASTMAVGEEDGGLPTA
jgi:hypothetical protein